VHGGMDFSGAFCWVGFEDIVRHWRSYVIGIHWGEGVGWGFTVDQGDIRSNSRGFVVRVFACPGMS